MKRGSLEIWFRFEAAGNGRRAIFGRSGVATIEAVSGRLPLRVGGRERLIRTGIRMDDGHWHYAVATFDGLTGAVPLWLDGKLRVSARLARVSQSPPVVVGAGALGRNFAGDVDAAAVYRVALPRLAIRWHHAAAS
jgi:hypothetical protein